MLELKISNIRGAAAKRSYGQESYDFQGHQMSKLTILNFLRSRDIVALKTGGPVLSENNIFKLWWFIRNTPWK